MEIKHAEYNYIKNKLKILESAYKQSIDDSVRKTVKDEIFWELCERIDGFSDVFSGAFEECTMGSLRQIDDLTKKVLEYYSVERLPGISYKEAKKLIKLNERDLNGFVKRYNDAVSKSPLTYYSERIEQKIVFLTQIDGELVGLVSDVPKKQHTGESLCYFCRRFGRGDDVVFVSNVVRTSKTEYTSIGQYCCSDYTRCNSELEDESMVKSFIGYGLKKKKNG